jgi:hypothetical protein
LLAKQARRILNLLDDTPVVPGDTHQTFEGVEVARQVLNDAEDDLRNWQPNLEPVHSTAGTLGVGAMPGSAVAGNGASPYAGEEAALGEHPAYREKSSPSRSGSGERRAASVGSQGSNGIHGGEVQPPYAMTEAERREIEQAGVI